MNLLWDQEPVVAPSEFSPFSHEVALPARISDASSQARAPLAPAAGTRPRRRSLLEIGLAHGDGADELDPSSIGLTEVITEPHCSACVGIPIRKGAGERHTLILAFAVL